MMSSNNLSPNKPVMRQITGSATVTVIGFAYFLIAVVALCFLNPEYTLVRSFTAGGNYDLGPHEFLIASTYFGLGLGWGLWFW